MTELEVVQWLFDTEVFTKALNWPVNADRMVFARRMLEEGLQGKQPAEDVMRAYETFAGAVGPTVMSSLLQSDDAFPEVNHSGRLTPPSAGKVTLYVDPKGKRVLAEVVLTHGMPPKFSVM
jgi:hypothetical protein